jgi:hypothetical protein
VQMCATTRLPQSHRTTNGVRVSCMTGLSGRAGLVSRPARFSTASSSPRVGACIRVNPDGTADKSVAVISLDIDNIRLS